MWASPKIPEEFHDESALVILSGGLDSCVALAVAMEYHETVLCATFGYGQQHGMVEADRAYRIALHLNVSIEPLTFDACPDSSLVFNNTEATPRAVREQKLPATFVPARNAVMIAIAAGYAYGRNIRCIYGGWNAIDYSGYPDCRPAFLDSIEHSMQLALGDPTAITLMTPLVTLTKRQIIELGLRHNAPLHLTYSCYEGREKPCNECDSCKIRAKGFKEACIADPALRV